MGINDYLKALQRRWPVVVVAGLLGLLIGYLVAPGVANQVGGPLSYSATVILLQAPDVEAAGRYDGFGGHLRVGRRACVEGTEHPSCATATAGSRVRCR